MTTEAEKLLAVFCDPTVTTGEVVGFFDVDMHALAVEKPSRPDREPPLPRPADPKPKEW